MRTLSPIILLLISTVSLSQSYKKLVKKSWESYDQGNLTEAIDFLVQALPGALEATDKEFQKSGPINPDYFTYTVLLNDIGTYYANIGMSQQAGIYFERALESQRKYLIYGESSMTQANLGGFYEQIGDYQNAEKQLVKAYEKSTDNEELLAGINVIHKFRVASFLATFYSNLGRKQEAREIFEIFLPVLEKFHGRENYTYIGALTRYVTLLPDDSLEWAAGVLKENLDILGKKLDKGIKSEDDHSVMLMYTIVEGELINNLISQNRLIEVRPYIDHLIIESEKFFGKNSPVHNSNLNLKGKYYYLINRYDSAAMVYEQILDPEPRTLHQLNYLQHYIRILLATKNPEVDKHFHVLINSYMKMIETLLPSYNEDQRRKFYNSLKPAFQLYFNYMIQKRGSSSAGQILDLQIATKGLLLNTFISVKTRILKSRDSTLLNKYYEWMDQRQFLASKRNPDESSDQNKIRQKADALERELSEAVKNIELPGSKRLTWQDLKKGLKEDEALVELIRLERYDSLPAVGDPFSKETTYDRFGFSNSVYYAAIVLKSTEEQPEIVLIEDGNGLENRWYKSYRNAISYKTNDLHSYKNFWSPINQSLAGVKKIYFNPDGVYHKISLSSLKNPTTGKYIPDETSIQFLTNSKELITTGAGKESRVARLYGRPEYKYSTSGNSTQRNFEDMADLPGTEKEITSIFEQLNNKGWSGEKFLKKDASETALKNADPPQILHIATHGFFMPEGNTSTHPLLNSGLLLSSDTQSDGILTAYEATGLDLEDTQLVVLSACETGLGEISNGEGVYGLQRGFRVAGAQNILMSLWKVDDDATFQLMDRFYNQLVKGDQSPHQALYEAQKQIRQIYPDPYYWAAFVVIGK